MQKQFLLVGNSPDSSWIEVLCEALSPLGKLDTASPYEFQEQLQQNRYHLIIIDAGSLDDALSLVGRIHQQQPVLPIVVTTISPTWQRARQFILAGAADYVRKSLDKKELLSTIEKILNK
jgi:DNA-binding NtrC family response regulator